MTFETTSSALRARRGAHGRPRLVASSPAPVADPRDGGRRRLREVARALAARIDVEVVSLAPAGGRASRVELAPGLIERCVPKGSRFEAAQRRLEDRLGGVPAGDLAMAFELDLAPEYLEALADAARGADLLLASHVYAFPALAAIGSAPVWLDAPDHECALKRSLLPPGPLVASLVDRLAALEAEAWRAAAWVTAASPLDGRTLAGRSGRDAERWALLPNGVDTGAIPFTPPSERAHRHDGAAAGSTPPFVLLFVGTHHGPNLEAVEWLRCHARELTGCELRLLGAAGRAHADRDHDSGSCVRALGEVSEARKLFELATADLGVAPMRAGTGSQLKVLEYAAAGLPVLTTPHGLRGLGFEPDTEVAVAELEQWPAEIERLRALPNRRETMACAARLRVEREHDWRSAVDAAVAVSPFVALGEWR